MYHDMMSIRFLQRLGLPTSDENLTESILQRAYGLPGSPFADTDTQTQILVDRNMDMDRDMDASNAGTQKVKS